MVKIQFICEVFPSFITLHEYHIYMINYYEKYEITSKKKKKKTRVRIIRILDRYSKNTSKK